MRHCPSFRSTDDTGFPVDGQKRGRFATWPAGRLRRDIQLRKAKPDWEFVLTDLDISEVATVDVIQRIARRCAQRARGTADEHQYSAYVAKYHSS